MGFLSKENNYKDLFSFNEKCRCFSGASCTQQSKFLIIAFQLFFRSAFLPLVAAIHLKPLSLDHTGVSSKSGLPI